MPRSPALSPTVSAAQHGDCLPTFSSAVTARPDSSQLAAVSARVSAGRGGAVGGGVGGAVEGRGERTRDQTVAAAGCANGSPLHSAGSGSELAVRHTAGRPVCGLCVSREAAEPAALPVPAHQECSTAHISEITKT